jgi:hypothetical protein
LNSFWNILRRGLRTGGKFLGLIPSTLAASDEGKSLREKRQAELEKFNQLLASAVNLKHLLEEQIRKLEAEETRCAARLAQSSTTTESSVTAEAACRLKNIRAELGELRQRLSEAAETVQGVTHLRDQAIAKARAEFKSISAPSA